MTPERMQEFNDRLRDLFAGADLLNQQPTAFQSLFGLPGYAWGYDTPPSSARRCSVDGHVWVETGTMRSWCKFCQADAVWDRDTACWKEVHG